MDIGLFTRLDVIQMHKTPSLLTSIDLDELDELTPPC